MKKLVLLLIPLSIALQSGCSIENAPVSSTQSGSYVSEQKEDRLRVKSSITFSDTSIELDYNLNGGHGSGLLKHGDNIYRVVIYDYVIFVEIMTNTFYSIDDLTYTCKLLNADNERSAVNSNGDIAYTGNYKGISVVTSYTNITTSVDELPVVSRYSKSLSELINEIKDYESIVDYEDIVSSKDDEATEVVKTSFYSNSEYGITVDGLLMSLNDYCNPMDYKQDYLPEGIVPQKVLDGDNTVEYLHVSYLASNGKITLKTLDGFVKSIEVTGSFSFLNIKESTTLNELKYLLGVNLKSSEKIDWSPIKGDPTVTKGSKANSFILTYEDFTVTILADKDYIKSIKLEVI